MVSEKTTQAYRFDSRNQGRAFTAVEREKLVEPYLPPVPSTILESNGKSFCRKPVRSFLKTQIHILVYHLIHTIFSIYIRLRQTYHAIVDRFLAVMYYHHRTPELIRKDVNGLSRIPEHLSVILTLREKEGGLEALMDEVAELTAWTTCAGIPMLSVYEKTGILKSYLPTLHTLTVQKLQSYFGPPPQTPKLIVHAPHHTPYSPPLNTKSSSTSPPSTLNLLLLSSSDGRATLVDLTKTLAEMSQSSKLSPADISSSLIDAEISELTCPFNPQASEPDLLIVFGPYVRLDGYPPWQVRLTEIFCTGDGGEDGVGEAVEYQGFLKGLWRYARAEMRFGR